MKLLSSVFLFSLLIGTGFIAAQQPEKIDSEILSELQEIDLTQLTDEQKKQLIRVLLALRVPKEAQ